MVGPAVIHAVELPRVAFALTANQRATMAAAIDQRMHLAFPVTAENDRAASYGTGFEVARIFQLRSMANIDPATIEDRALFTFEHLVRDEDFAIDEKSLRFRVLDDEFVTGGETSPRGHVVHLDRSCGAILYRNTGRVAQCA